jgi:hypothetical protein
MEELELYRREFNSLARAVYSASLGEEPNHKNKYGMVLYDEIKDVPVARSLELEDIKQELRLYWFIFVEKYHQSKPDITLRQYLLRRSIWALRDWYHWVQKPEGPSLIKQGRLIKSEFPFKLDVKFLINGATLYPFSLLTAYQRYILYLRYKEKKTVKEIAKMVVKTRKTVGLELKKVIKFLRSKAKDANQSKDPG